MKKKKKRKQKKSSNGKAEKKISLNSEPFQVPIKVDPGIFSLDKIRDFPIATSAVKNQNSSRDFPSKTSSVNSLDCGEEVPPHDENIIAKNVLLGDQELPYYAVATKKDSSSSSEIYQRVPHEKSHVEDNKYESLENAKFQYDIDNKYESLEDAKFQYDIHQKQVDKEAQSSSSSDDQQLLVKQLYHHHLNSDYSLGKEDNNHNNLEEEDNNLASENKSPGPSIQNEIIQDEIMTPCILKETLSSALKVSSHNLNRECQQRDDNDVFRLEDSNSFGIGSPSFGKNPENPSAHEDSGHGDVVSRRNINNAANSQEEDANSPFSGQGNSATADTPSLGSPSERFASPMTSTPQSLCIQQRSILGSPNRIVKKDLVENHDYDKPSPVENENNCKLKKLGRKKIPALGPIALSILQQESSPQGKLSSAHSGGDEQLSPKTCLSPRGVSATPFFVHHHSPPGSPRGHDPNAIVRGNVKMRHLENNRPGTLKLVTVGKILAAAAAKTHVTEKKNEPKPILRRNLPNSLNSQLENLTVSEVEFSGTSRSNKSYSAEEHGNKTALRSMESVDIPSLLSTTAGDRDFESRLSFSTVSNTDNSPMFLKSSVDNLRICSGVLPESSVKNTDSSRQFLLDDSVRIEEYSDAVDADKLCDELCCSLSDTVPATEDGVPDTINGPLQTNSGFHEIVQSALNSSKTEELCKSQQSISEADVANEDMDSLTGTPVLSRSTSAENNGFLVLTSSSLKAKVDEIFDDCCDLGESGEFYYHTPLKLASSSIFMGSSPPLKRADNLGIAIADESPPLDDVESCSIENIPTKSSSETQQHERSVSFSETADAEMKSRSQEFVRANPHSLDLHDKVSETCEDYSPATRVSEKNTCSDYETPYCEMEIWTPREVCVSTKGILQTSPRNIRKTAGEPKNIASPRQKSISPKNVRVNLTSQVMMIEPRRQSASEVLHDFKASLHHAAKVKAFCELTKSPRNKGSLRETKDVVVDNVVGPGPDHQDLKSSTNNLKTNSKKTSSKNTNTSTRTALTVSNQKQQLLRNKNAKTAQSLSAIRKEVANAMKMTGRKNADSLPDHDGEKLLQVPGRGDSNDKVVLSMKKFVNENVWNGSVKTKVAAGGSNYKSRKEKISKILQKKQQISANQLIKAQSLLELRKNVAIDLIDSSEDNNTSLSQPNSKQGTSNSNKTAPSIY